MMFKCIQEPKENQWSPQPDNNYHSIWEKDGLRYYVAGMGVVTLDLQYAWVAVSELIPGSPKEVMRGKFKIDRMIAMTEDLRPGTEKWHMHWRDQFVSSVVMNEFALLMSKLASSFYGKEVKYEQQV